MESSSIELPGSEVEACVLEGDRLSVRFSRAFIVKSMTGSAERTRWHQRGELILGGVALEGDLPQGPLVCAGGDVGENVYTYRDMIPIPLDSRGRASCNLRFAGTDQRLVAQGDSVMLRMFDVPKYIEHLRPGA